MLCLSELRGLQELQTKHADIVVLAVSTADDRPAIEKVLKTKKIDALRVAIGKEWSEKFGVGDKLPATIIVANGKIRVVHDSVLLDPVAELEADMAAVK